MLDSKYREYLLANTNLIRQMASLKVDADSNLQELMQNILLEARITLKVTRISVWLFKGTSEDTGIKCVANTEW